jgi:hypothetical protein
MSDLETRLRAIGELLPDPDDGATEEGRRAMHAARASASWATGRRRSWFASRGPRTYLIAAALALAVGGGALAAGGWGISDLPPFGDDDRSAFVLPATDILPGGYERTRPPTYADLPARPSLLFPAGVGYTEALARYSAARQAGRILPEGVELTDPLPAGKVVMVRSDGRVALDPAAPFGYSATTGLVTTLSAPFDGRAIPIARCQLLIGADDSASPACDQAGVRRAYVTEGVNGRWVPSPNEEGVFDRLTPASTELSVVDRPTTPRVVLPAHAFPFGPSGSRSGTGPPVVGRLALQTRDVRLIVAAVKPDQLCFIGEERGGGSSWHCGPRSTFLNRGAVLGGGRFRNGPLRINGLVGDGVTQVRTNDGIVARVTHNVFTMLPGPATRVLTFTGPVGSFRVAYPRGSGGPPSAPDRSKQRELLGVDLADGGHASIRVAPNRGDGRCTWVYVNGNSRSFGCFGPGGPSLPLDQVTGGFIRRIDRIPSLFQGEFASGIGSVEIGYADGTSVRLRPTERFVLYEVPAGHMRPGHQAVSITTFDHQGVALVREEVRRPGTIGP